MSHAIRARVRRRVRRASPDDETDLKGELNIVPFLDIVVNLLLFMLAVTTAVVGISQVEAQLPSIGPGRPHLALSVSLTRSGAVVATRGGVLAPGCGSYGGGIAVPRRGASYDWAALRACAERIKAQHPSAENVILTADPEVSYEQMVFAMDALRGTPARPLYPRIRLSAGVR